MTSVFTPARFPADPTADDLAAMWEAMAPDPETPEPAIRGVMITTIDGRAAVDGRCGPMGTPTDELVLHGMRARADVVVVGARTAMLEDYGPSYVHPAWADFRQQPEPPRLVLVTRTVTEDTLEHLQRRGPKGFTLVVPDGDPGADRAEGKGLDVLRLAADPVRGLRQLAATLGAKEVACEGGPTLLASMLSADIVDELMLTTSPRMDVTPESIRMVGHTCAVSRPFRVATCFTAPDGGLYTRWVRDRDRDAE